MSILSYTQLEQAQDITTSRESVPEWGGAVILRTLTAADRHAAARFIEANPDLDSVCVQLAMGMINEAGERIVPLKDVAIRVLMSRSSNVVMRLVGKLNAMSAIGAGAVEAEKKDSAPTET